MKLNLVLIALIALSAAAAHASPPTECIGKPAAWIKNVLYAVDQAHYKGVTAEDIRQTSNDNHDPVYEVTVAAGQTVTVSCDDSGDDDCQCSVGAS